MPCIQQAWCAGTTALRSCRRSSSWCPLHWASPACPSSTALPSRRSLARASPWRLQIITGCTHLALTPTLTPTPTPSPSPNPKPNQVHAPCAGTLLHADLTSAGMGPYSKSKNEANPTNRRALLVLGPPPPTEPRSGTGALGGCCALVLVGSLAADSVRLEPGVEAGAEVARGQRLGCFTGGGSAA
eukprot:scaffold13749_cov60-Phaeocystis_antarctica.AAC.4